MPKLTIKIKKGAKRPTKVKITRKRNKRKSRGSIFA